MAPIFILFIGIGGLLMYEAYKGTTVSGLKTKATNIGGTAAGKKTG